MSRLEGMLSEVLAAHAGDAGDGGPLLDGIRRRERRRRRRTVGVATAAVLVAVVGVASVVHRSPRPAPALPAGHTPTASVSSSQPPDERDGATALAGGRWTTTPPSPSGTRLGSLLVWDGDELLQLGGAGTGTRTGAAALDPRTGRWRTLADAPFPIATDYQGTTDSQPRAVWTGKEVFVLTGRGAALLDPVTGTWTTLPAPPLSHLDAADLAVAAGEVLVTTQATGTARATEVAVLTPATRRWARLDPPAVERHDPLGVLVTGVGDDVMLWSLWGHTESTGVNETTGTSGIDVHRLGPDRRWRTVTGAWPQHEAGPTPLYTGSRLVLPPGQIWCGACSHPASFDAPGYLVDPTTFARQTINPVPDNRSAPWVWTGQTVLAVDLAVWDPRSNTWTSTPAAPAGLDDRTVAVWGGHQLFAVDTAGRLLSYAAHPPPWAGGATSGG